MRERGEVAEWLMAPVLKTGIPERVSGVQIPPSPPCFEQLHIEYFFWANASKLLILPDLPDFDTPSTRQNIADKRLTRKIFQNRELAVCLDFAIADTSPLLPLRTVPLCAPCILGQGCSSQAMDFFLWKAVEKD